MRLIPESRLSSQTPNNFDALRLAMAMLVIWSHSFAMHLGSERTEWISLLLNGVYNAGNIGVMAFFIISGFLITQSIVRSRSTWSYFEKRIRRIYPGYMVATVVSGFVLVIMLAPNASPTFIDELRMIAMNLLLRNYAPVAGDFGGRDGGLLAINGALWSIPYEFWCYIGVAALGGFSLASKRYFLLTLLASVMLLHLGLDILGRKPGLGIIGLIFGWPYLWTRMLPCFLLGMVAYSFRDRLPRSPLLLSGLLLAAVIGCNISHYVGDLAVAPALAYAIFYFAFSETIQFHNAAAFGDFSYGTYLYGFVIQKILAAIAITKTWNTATFFAVSLTLSLIAGFISWHVVEKRFLLSRREPTKAAAEPIQDAPALSGNEW